MMRSNSSLFSCESSSLSRYSLQRIKQFCNAVMSLQLQIFVSMSLLSMVSCFIPQIRNL